MLLKTNLRLSFANYHLFYKFLYDLNTSVQHIGYFLVLLLQTIPCSNYLCTRFSVFWHDGMIEWCLTTVLPIHLTQARNNLIRRLVGTTWGANYNTLKVSATALCFSVAEYCDPVWCNSVHTRLVDRALNESMRIVSGCIRSTPVEQLSVLCGILPPDLRREKTCLALLHRAMADDDHLLHHWTDANYVILTRLPRRPPSSRMRSLFKEAGPSHSATFAADKWQLRWNNNNLKIVYMPKVSETPLGCHLQRKEWMHLNRIRCGHGRFKAALHKWGLC